MLKKFWEHGHDNFSILRESNFIENHVIITNTMIAFSFNNIEY